MLKARVQLQQNIAFLLLDRKETQKTLAFVMNVHPTTVNKFLKGTRELQLDQLDKVAAFFGMEVHQLFRPGIAVFSERRKLADRRSGRERRVGHAVRHAVTDSGLGDAAKDAAHGGRPVFSAAVAAEIQRANEAYARDVNAILARHAGEQTPAARGHLSKTRPVRRTSRRPDASRTGT